MKPLGPSGFSPSLFLCVISISTLSFLLHVYFPFQQAWIPTVNAALRRHMSSLIPSTPPHIYIYTHMSLHSNKQYAYLTLKVRDSPPVSHFHYGSICLICGQIWLDSDSVGCRREEFGHHAVTFPSQLKSKQTTERIQNNILYCIIFCRMHKQNIKPHGVCKHIFSKLYFSLIFVSHNVPTMYHLKCKICFIAYCFAESTLLKCVFGNYD